MASQAEETSAEILESDNANMPQFLPPELWHQILDCLIQTPNGYQPAAFEPAHVVTRTLRALTFVCKLLHPVASKYLYSHCVFVSRARFQKFRSCLVDQARARLDRDLVTSNSSRDARDLSRLPVSGHDNVAYITSCIVDFDDILQIDLVLSTIGSNLKRLVLDMDPAHMNSYEDDVYQKVRIRSGVLASMSSLHELVVTSAMATHFEKPPPNLKRLALAGSFIDLRFIQYYVSPESLEMLVMEREAASYIVHHTFPETGHGVDLVLAAENTRHGPLDKQFALLLSKQVRPWEVDIPRSFYGDDDNQGRLYAEWLWMHAKQGTLWTQDKRRPELPKRGSTETSL